MGGKTITRADLAEAVYRKVGLSRTESSQLVEMVLDEICGAIVRGETVMQDGKIVGKPGYGRYVARQLKSQ